ncbi:unnamed protein product [Bursaphelenchus xylophilus]|uniref:(pine wood nematode) hypothetical protein n=1 Tax=Bursaphelenchus xylophilus TaxID=6326 RepID=A0A7I8WVH7_BURXY|nr:unnamed protein product [Bursaphelenchus xylophilus]CAG9117670.1 unnamed protein product [Bursaphelenchus xylophilus]
MGRCSSFLQKYIFFQNQIGVLEAVLVPSDEANEKRTCSNVVLYLLANPVITRSLMRSALSKEMRMIFKL